MTPSLAIVGSGRVGTVLALGLQRAGYPVVAAASRSRASAEALAARVPGCRVVEPPQAVGLADLVLLTVADDAIGQMAAALPWRAGQAAVHCSAATSVDALRPAADAGAAIGGLHPLQAFATDPELALAGLRGAAFAVEAQGPLLGTLEAMAAALGGTPIRIPPEMRGVYHASAAFAATTLLVGVQQAVDLWGTFGVEPEQALQSLMPLVRGTLANLETVGLPVALTGPIGRGDARSIGRHLAGLGEHAPHLLPLYVEMSLRAVEVALAGRTIDETRADELRHLLREAPIPAGRSPR